MPTEIPQKIFANSNVNTLRRVSRTCRHLYRSMVPLINAKDIFRLKRLIRQEKLSAFKSDIFIDEDEIDLIYTDEIDVQLAFTYGDPQNLPDYRALARVMTSNPILNSVEVTLRCHSNILFSQTLRSVWIRQFASFLSRSAERARRLNIEGGEEWTTQSRSLKLVLPSLERCPANLATDHEWSVVEHTNRPKIPLNFSASRLESLEIESPVLFDATFYWWTMRVLTTAPLSNYPSSTFISSGTN